ncbi:MAG: DegV family protein [Dehalococcoidia bacterium]|nr:DegV family protein [Dehalococcoidia bacterium]
MAVRIVTDSTCDLPSALVQAHGITVVPLTVFFGDEARLDGVEISAGEFYDRLRASSELPRTSQPSVELFRETYERVAADGDEIVSIHLSSKLSGTLNAASIAREEVAPLIHVDLIDSYQVSLGLGLIVLEAARAAQSGRRCRKSSPRRAVPWIASPSTSTSIPSNTSRRAAASAGPGRFSAPS